VYPPPPPPPPPRSYYMISDYRYALFCSHLRSPPYPPRSPDPGVGGLTGLRPLPPTPEKLLCNIDTQRRFCRATPSPTIAFVVCFPRIEIGRWGDSELREGEMPHCETPDCEIPDCQIPDSRSRNSRLRKDSEIVRFQIERSRDSRLRWRELSLN